MARRKSYQKGNLDWHNGNWTVRYYERDRAGNWKLKRHRLEGFSDPKKKKAARNAADEFIASINQYNNSPTPRKATSQLTFEVFIEKRWKAYAATAKHKRATVDTYDGFMKNHLLPIFGSKLMTDITPSDISDFFDTRRGMLATNTLQTLYSMLHLIFEIARQYDLIEQSPVRPLVHKPEIKKKEKPTLQPEQIRSVLRHMPELERLYLILLSTTGMRMNEGLALRWMDFNAEQSTITIAHSIYKGELESPKTVSSHATLGLHPAIASMLARQRHWAAFQAEDDFIFCRHDGQPLSRTTIRKHLYRAMEQAGIKRVTGEYGFHIFRHSAGTLLYGKLRDLKAVQAVLRHSDISTTADIYVHAGQVIASEGSALLAEEILGELLADYAPTMTQTSKLVS